MYVVVIFDILIMDFFCAPHNTQSIYVSTSICKCFVQFLCQQNIDKIWHPPVARLMYPQYITGIFTILFTFQHYLHDNKVCKGTNEHTFVTYFTWQLIPIYTICYYIYF